MSWTASIRALFRRRRKRQSQEVGWLRAENNARRPESSASEQVVLPLCGLLALFALGWTFYHFHFRSNPQFILRELTIATGENLNEMLVREYLGLHEGMPLFERDIERRRLDLLADAPNIRSVSITRRLPSRILIRVVEREPVGRIGRGGQVVDGEGVIFPRYAGVDHLPVLTGFEGIQVQPGVKLEGMGLAAVRLLSTIARPEYTLPVAMVDLSHQDYLHLMLSDQRQIKLWWKGMDTDSMEANESLRRRLHCLLQAMSLAPMRRMWDATVPDESRIFSPY